MPKKKAEKSTLQLALDEQVALQQSCTRAARSIARILAPFAPKTRGAVLGLVVQAMNSAEQSEAQPPCCDSVPPTTEPAPAQPS